MIAFKEPAGALAGFFRVRNQPYGECVMGKGILLWLIGVPIPLIILLLIFWH
ncbi:hypothetical protein [Sphingomonas sp.]|uniref:hypothetical protein n=1 Tax=Sphingomonas sp. TaxID=28214 RepID=UPI001B2D08C7|nr:hypothetical protein [Sphingomonas sp.]MBO9711948.1 hypothetical protein [Sphingomonas sp.]